MWTQSFFRAVLRALLQWRLAWLLAEANIAEVRRVNKVALVTPFLSLLVQVGFLSLVYSALFNIDIRDYIPYLAVSLAVWQFLSVFVMTAVGYNDVANRHLSFPALSVYTIHLSGLIESVLLLLAKMLAACLVILVIRKGLPGFSSLLMAVAGCFVLTVFMFFAGILASWVFDRFRFLRALLPQLLFLAFLITPVIWHKDQLGDSHWVADFNPLTHLLEIVRAPLLENSVAWTSLAVVLAITAVMAVLGITVHRANREMVLYRWVA